SSATLQTSGGTIVLGPASGIGPPGPAVFPTTGQSLTFSTSAGASTLNLVGGQVVTLSPGVGTTISAGVTLTSDHGITFNVNSGTFTNNGTVSYIGSATNATTIAVLSTGTLSFAGTPGHIAPGAGNTVLWTAPSSITLSNGLVQMLTN